MSETRECEVEWCDNRHYAKGLCRSHYYYLKKTGRIAAKPDIDGRRKHPMYGAWGLDGNAVIWGQRWPWYSINGPDRTTDSPNIPMIKAPKYGCSGPLGKPSQFPSSVRQLLFGGGMIISACLIILSFGSMLLAGVALARSRWYRGGGLVIGSALLMFLSWAVWAPWL
jgi:hypothetical protein